MSLFNLIRAPFNAWELKRTDRQLSKLVWQRGMLSNEPLLCMPLDIKIDALMRHHARLENTALVSIPLDFVCHSCSRRHRENVTPERFSSAYSDWYQKHPAPEHRVESFVGRRSLPGSRGGFSDRIYEMMGAAPWWLYMPNADIKSAYGASAAFTCAIETTPLASSATFVVGRESTAISNTTNLYLDYSVGGKITVGTTPTVLTYIFIYLYGSVNDTPTYCDVLDGTDSDETFTSVEIRAASVRYLHDTLVNATTSNRVYWFAAKGIGSAFEYVIPKNFGVWVTHSTVAALNSTGSNHIINYSGIYATG